MRQGASDHPSGNEQYDPEIRQQPRTVDEEPSLGALHPGPEIPDIGPGIDDSVNDAQDGEIRGPDEQDAHRPGAHEHLEIERAEREEGNHQETDETGRGEIDAHTGVEDADSDRQAQPGEQLLLPPVEQQSERNAQGDRQNHVPTPVQRTPQRSGSVVGPCNLRSAIRSSTCAT